MFYSSKENLLFIAAPKTGSTSVETKLANWFPEGTRFKIELENGRIITSAEVCSPSLGHAKAREFKEVLGEQAFNQLHVFGFVRDPIDKLVSSYFFTRSGSLAGALNIKTEKRKMPMVLKGIFSILLARALPLWLWSILYSMRDCHSYFTDENGRPIVDYLGATNRLSTDFVEIMEGMGYRFPEQSVPHTNSSQHKKPEDYRFFRFWIPFLRRRYRRDSELFQLVEAGVWINPQRDKDRLSEL